MRVLVEFKSIMNLVWGKPILGYEAFAFLRGFPATFLMTERRAIVFAIFMEKQGWFRKRKIHRVCFEAGLHEVKEFKMNIIPDKRIFSGFISFNPHNDIGENATIQFLHMRPEIAIAIEEHLTDLKIKSPVKDSGIVLVDDICPNPQLWINKRLGLKKKIDKAFLDPEVKSIDDFEE
jgi:hypothetical protein